MFGIYPKECGGEHCKAYRCGYAPPAYTGGGGGTASRQFAEQCFRNGAWQLHRRLTDRRMDIRPFAYQHPDGDKRHEDTVQPDGICVPERAYSERL